jgi:hypothetical protein
MGPVLKKGTTGVGEGYEALQWLAFRKGNAEKRPQTYVAGAEAVKRIFFIAAAGDSLLRADDCFRRPPSLAVTFPACLNKLPST